jgi:hypothetical protein
MKLIPIINEISPISVYRLLTIPRNLIVAFSDVLNFEMDNFFFTARYKTYGFQNIENSLVPFTSGKFL